MIRKLELYMNTKLIRNNLRFIASVAFTILVAGCGSDNNAGDPGLGYIYGSVANNCGAGQLNVGAGCTSFQNACAQLGGLANGTNTCTIQLYNPPGTYYPLSSGSVSGIKSFVSFWSRQLPQGARVSFSGSGSWTGTTSYISYDFFGNTNCDKNYSASDTSAGLFGLVGSQALFLGNQAEITMPQTAPLFVGFNTSSVKGVCNYQLSGTLTVRF